ncbi:MAG TPA: radical SAM protein [Defluviicoccus sp.]|nr:radical SAM protein [Defluviicoccus sp.]
MTMAAIAGSKGRVRISDARPSFHVEIVDQLLSGAATPRAAARALMDRAKLREAGVDTNMVCNLACRYCYLGDRPEQKGTANLDALLAYLKALVSSGARLIAFIGKEPLADNRALTLLRALADWRQSDAPLWFRTGMVTNGTLIDQKLEALLASGVSYLDVSLDGIGQDTDSMRGKGVFAKAIANVERLLSDGFDGEFAITSVMHRGNRDRFFVFADEMFSRDVPTVFTSPILRFTDDLRISNWALTHEEIVRLIEQCVGYAAASGLNVDGGQQLILDLPYKYSWYLVRSGHVQAKDIWEDGFEAQFYQPDPNVNFVVKMNFLSLSFWRALRVTHDGTVVENMDLAAHPGYASNTHHLSGRDRAWYFGGELSRVGEQYHDWFFRRHACSQLAEDDAHYREVDVQYEKHLFAAVGGHEAENQQVFA